MSRSGSTAFLTINGSQLAIELADNDTAAAFAAMLPMQVEMSELNSNEKYAYLGETLPSNASNPGTIEAGDLMLYGDNCLVVFYESHPTTYSYTRIGKITDASGLKAIVGSGSVNASFALD
ncbi:cyclophilin-like fold protein [Adlercreutzia sp. ZJ138]|uniref:cyclophilin-like fold protein n=1 Tax=Adlercreutzia sp. ZJ138 TaxID=2709405 RepID=UPI0013EB3B89|nr:cyclophilin-like fold protein [Adlercreutzia sp. ZJ138]